MMVERLPTPRTRWKSAFLAAPFLVVSVVHAEDTPKASATTAAESAPAMQGHDAEARMREPDAEARWRRLFFDAATREEGEPQVSCDHRAARRPDAVAGPAAVAIAWDPASGRVIARLWATSDGDPLDLSALTRRLAASTPSGLALDALAFRRCR